ncbi:MAG: class I adenylate-forming enzyme family protein [Acidimicrobiia bacterium]
MSDLDLLDADPAPDTLNQWARHLGHRVIDPGGLRAGLSSGPTLSAAFTKTARRHPRREALTINGITLSHQEVDVESARAGAALQGWGIGAGNHVTVVADTDLSVVIAYLGALQVGAIVTFADPTYTVAELGRVLAASHADMALATGPSLALIAEAGDGRPTLGLNESDRYLVAHVLHDRLAENVFPAPTDPEATAILAFTSGSTGAPKPVPLTHRNLLSSMRGALIAWHWSENDRLVHSLPVGHQHGLGGVHASLLTGSHSVILPRFDAEELLATIGHHDATILFAVPAIYQRLVLCKDSKVEVLGRLRLMVSGSAPLPVPLADRVQGLTGQLPIERYGSTEAGLDVSNPYRGTRIPGTVGLALPGLEVALVGEDDRPVDRGESGEVVLRGPQVFSGYLGADDGQAFLHGWFRTGDVGTVDEESGHLRLVGRAKEMIITGGANVSPREVENVLRSVPGVLDAAVIGAPSPRWGEEVTAFVVLEGSPLERITDVVVRSLAPFKRPKRIIEVAEIPRTETGKVRQEALALMLETDTSD